MEPELAKKMLEENIRHEIYQFNNYAKILLGDRMDYIVSLLESLTADALRDKKLFSNL